MNHRTKDGSVSDYPANFIAHINGVCPCEKCRTFQRDKAKATEERQPEGDTS